MFYQQAQVWTLRFVENLMLLIEMRSDTVLQRSIWYLVQHGICCDKHKVNLVICTKGNRTI